jgi:hypothetical protein
VAWLGAVAVGAAAAEPDDAAIHFFRTHPNAIDVAAPAGRILFANRQVGLEFRQTARGFELARLYGIAAGRDFLTAPPAAAPRDLFEIRLTTDPRRVGKDDTAVTREGRIGLVLERMAEMGKAFVVGSQTGARVTWRLDPGENESTLCLQWHAIDVKEDKGALDAEVTVRLRAGDPLTYWRIALRNRSLKYGIERATLPLVSLAPIGEAAENVLIYPKWRGGYVLDPFHAPAGLGENYHRTGAYYPYYVNLQFWALYNRTSRHGLYLGTRDPTPNLTHFLVRNTAEEIAWSVSHFPPNLGFAAENFTLPYDCVIGPFAGDWYDACQIYRDWALAQSWCRKGPLATRSDIPRWYKESPLFFYTLLADSAAGTHSMEENLKIAAADFKAWLAWAGLKLPVNWYGFEKPTPGLSIFDRPASPRRPYPATSNVRQWAGFASQFTSYAGNYPAIPALEQFSAVCQDLRTAGGMVCPYVCLQLFNQGPLDNAPFAAEGRLAVARDTYGAILTYPGLGMWLPCVASTWWQNRLIDECVTLLGREHVGGFYLDVMHGTGMPCFWTPHGHTSAGASAMTTGMHRLSGAVRDAVKARDPEVITTGEDPAENMIDVIDGALYQRTLRPENQVPLFATVYQDYIPRYGLELSVGRGDSFFIECASLFVEGAQIGRLQLRPRGGGLSLRDPAHREMVDFLGRVVGYYKQEGAKKFLVYGRLLRPLTFTVPATMPLLRHGKPEGEATTDTGAALSANRAALFPQLMSGVFRAPDGEIGVFVVNAGASESAFEAALDPAQLGSASGAGVDIHRVSPTGESEPIMAKVRGTISLRGSLAARGIVLFRLKTVISP